MLESTGYNDIRAAEAFANIHNLGIRVEGTCLISHALQWGNNQIISDLL